jgi:hypothetical protein
MAASTVRVRGLSELQRDLGKVSREAEKSVRDGMKLAALPVVAAARAKEGKWPGSKPGSIGIRATRRSVFVTQRARKVTGRRADFGALQMREAFVPALDENEHLVRREVEHALDHLLDSVRL